MKRIIQLFFSWLCYLFVAIPALSVKLFSSNELFTLFSQLFAIVPGKIGSYIRASYYRITLKYCSNDVFIGFGTYFPHRDVEIHKGVYIGAYCIIGMARIGEDVTIASAVHILSGKKQHGYEKIGVPIQKQEGSYQIISIGNNCWIGSCSVIMANLGKQNVVAAGSVIIHDTKDYEILGGNPAKVIKIIKEGQDSIA